MQWMTQEGRDLMTAINDLYEISTLTKSEKRDNLKRHRPIRAIISESLSDLLSYAPDSPYLDPESIYIYKVSADSKEFKKFLPWFMDKVAEEEDFSPGTQLVFKKIAESRFSAWDDADRERLKTYVYCFWRAYLASEETMSGPMEMLNCFSYVVGGIGGFLKIWEEYFESCSKTALVHMYEFVEFNWIMSESKISSQWAVNIKSDDMEWNVKNQEHTKEWLLTMKENRIFEEMCLGEKCSEFSEQVCAIADALTRRFSV